MKTLIALQDLIEEEIQGMDYSDHPPELYEPMKYTLNNGGKRLRPALALMGCQLFSDDVSKAAKPAIGLEMFHNFTLLHDDIMDKAFMRRSQPTVHIKWDVNRAILSGDALAIMSNVFISSCDKEVLPQVLQVFNSTALQVCEGQQYDLNFERMDRVAEQEYLQMIKKKTAVLLAGSLQIGSLIGGADQKWSEEVYRFGLDMGMAFQLQDDYLDTFGDSRVFGKKVGGDIQANKKTYLLIKAYELASSQQVKELDGWFSTKDHPAEKKLKAVKTIMQDLGIEELTRGKVREYSLSALKILETIPVEKERKEELRIFTEELMHRVK